MGSRTRHWVPFAAVGAVVVAVAAGAAAVALVDDDGGRRDDDGGRREQAEDLVIEDPTDQEVTAAVAAGELVLPEGADVLALSSGDDRGWRHRLVVGMAPGADEDLLAGSGFTVPLRPVAGLTFATVDGYEPPADRSLLYGQDSLGSSTPVAYREVAVDRSDPARTVVHVFVWQT